MNPERIEFGARLKQQREARALSVPDVVKLTKIPERSVQLLESGAFDELPAEVFVRGFLKSYCRAVGLDGDEIIQAYEGLVARDRRRPPSLASVGQPRSREREPEREAAPAKPDDDHAILTALSEAGKGTGRMGLTLAVIILVIVATLTLSLLLRRPSHVGDGVSSLETEAAVLG